MATAYMNNVLSNTPVTAHPGAGKVVGIDFRNRTASDVYVRLFDCLAADVSLTAPVTPHKDIFLVPANGGRTDDGPYVAYLHAVSVVCTTTPDGTSAPGTGLFAKVYVE